MRLTRLVARATIATPLGPLRLAATGQGLAVAWFDAQAHSHDLGDVAEHPSHPVLRQAAAEFDAWFADPRRPFTVPMDPAGSTFQQAVWRALLAIPPGQTRAYGEVARAIGRPEAVRAVGAAIGRNPIAIAVPCHRVLGAGGALTGYAGGLPRKQALLALEAGVRALALEPAGVFP